MAEPTRVTLLGFTITGQMLEGLLLRDKGMPTQTHKFAWALVQALTSAGCIVTLLSAMPASTFPRNSQILFRGKQFEQDNLQGRLLGFINLAVLKHVTRTISCWLVGNKAISAWKSDVVLVHGVHTPFLWCAVLMGRLRRVKVVPVLTDPPGVVLPFEGKITATLKKLDIWLVRNALRRCDGVIALTSALADDFAPGVPRLIMEGIWSDPGITPERQQRRTDEGFHILYAGGLSRAYGVDRLVEAVRAMSYPNVRLHVYGRGELAPWIEAQALMDPRICGPEFLSSESLQDKLSAADVLVNPRPVDQEFVKYSFPSKLIEYLASGTTVITTRLPGIPEEYDRKLIFADPDTADGLNSALRRVMDMSAIEKEDLSTSARDFIQTTRSTEGQGNKIAQFVQSLADGSTLQRLEHSSRRRNHAL